MSTINLQDWVGKQEAIKDHAYATPVKALSLTLNYSDFPDQDGDPLPELWHWFYFLPMVAMANVGSDGHPKRGGFLPPIELERRMWASGRLNFQQDLLIGEEISKVSEILKISEKEGKAGKMVFVTVRHQIHSSRGMAVDEEQDIVYLPMPRAFVAPPANPLPDNLQWKEEYPIDPVLLFRFSALTFNGHKIHYDRTYATDVEKYPGLVVHGPLQALLLFEFAKQKCPGKKPANFSFRATRPLFDFDTVYICGKSKEDGSVDLFTANGDSNIGMQATMVWR